MNLRTWLDAAKAELHKELAALQSEKGNLIQQGQGIENRLQQIEHRIAQLMGKAEEHLKLEKHLQEPEVHSTPSGEAPEKADA